MQKNKIKYLSTSLFFIVTLCHFAVVAQDGHRTFNFKNGSYYQTDVLINSKSLVQRGKQILEINSTSNVSKLAQVTATGDNDFTFNVSIKKLDVLINAMGKKLHYNSVAGENSSTITGALDFMIKNPVDLKINKYGIIESSTKEKIEVATDTLIAFAGIQPDIFQKGKLFDILADITYTKNLQKGHNWTEILTVGKDKITTKFWIENINEKSTVLKFTSSSIGELINSNSNGTYLIDNDSGIVLEKLVYVISVGYQVSAGGIMYGTSRSANIFEKTKLIPSNFYIQAKPKSSSN